jgi:hypothetical protein
MANHKPNGNGNGFENMFNNDDNAGDANPLPFDAVNEVMDVLQLLPLIRQRIRQAPYIHIDNPFHPIRVNVLFIVSEPFAAGAELLRERTIRIVGNVLLNGNPTVEIPVLQRTVIEILRYLERNRNHPYRPHIVNLLYAMIVRDNRLGNNIQLANTFAAILNTAIHIPHPNILHNVIGILQLLFQPDNPIAQQHDAQHGIIANFLITLFNHPIIVQQPNHNVQHQFILRLFELLHNPPQQNQMEHLELISLMLQLLVAPQDGFDEQQRARLGELMNGLHQDPAGHMFIENFENVLMEIIADDEPAEEVAPEASITNVSSQSRVALSREQHGRPQSARSARSARSEGSSQQTRERQVDERMKSTATSKRRRER